MTRMGLRHPDWMIVAVSLALFGLAACSSPGGSLVNNTPVIQLATLEVIPSPSGSYGALAWLGDWIVVDYEVELKDAYSGRIWRLRPDGSEFEMLDLPAHSSCASDWIKAVIVPSVLPDGRMEYISRCRPPDDILGKMQFAIAYDMESQQAEPLLDYSVADFSLGTGGLVWNPTMTRGIMGDGHVYIEEQLRWFTDEGPEPLDVGLVQAYGADWSRDGEMIAFIGSEKQGSPGVLGDYELYLMNKNGEAIRPIVEGFKASGGVSWSPDGRWLAFPAIFGEQEGDDQGVWIVSPESGDLLMIAEGGFGRPAWSPDGQRMVVVQFLGPASEREHRLVILDVGAILNE
ncbi:MAG: hypothetical protein V3U32_00435 [Anaerolineales bacterium]